MRPGIEPRSPEPLANTLPTRLICQWTVWYEGLIFLSELSALKRKEIILKNRYLLRKIKIFFNTRLTDVSTYTVVYIYIRKWVRRTNW